MSKLREVFDEINNRISETENCFNDWNDSKADEFKEVVEQLKNAIKSLKTKAIDYVYQCKEMKTIQNQIEDFFREAEKLCR